MVSEPFSKEAVREDFLNHLRWLSNYWAVQTGLEGEELSTKEKIEGALFSLLNAFDGTSSFGPSMDLVLRPHPDDKEYAIENGEDYYEDGMVINDDVYLHDMFFEKKV